MAVAAQAKHCLPVRRSRASRLGTLLLAGGLAGLAGCTPTGSNEFPPGVQDPAVIKTPEGALAFYHGVVNSVGPLFEPVVAYSGLMTDELTATPMPVGASGTYTALDSRQIANTTVAIEIVNGDAARAGMYGPLHQLRAQAREARGFLATYLPDSTALVGQLYAFEGYAVTLLADLYCSGVPLSTVNFGADYTMAAGSSTVELYQHAQAFFDSAATLAGAADTVRQLAAIGRGRALLALGRYAEAAAAVASVPTEFRYAVAPPLVSQASTNLLASFSSFPPGSRGLPSMGDREGGNGLDYRSSGDPRTPAAVLNATPDAFGNTVYFPAKYPADGPATYVLADGIEARLIEAEAALNGGAPASGAWLTTLNALRTDGTFDTQPNADDPSKTDTLWHAGTGGVAGLDTLSDPGTVDARVSLLFRERAFWLYLTAHRQGDLRRLIRQYHHPTGAVYPTGSYAGGNGRYGDDVTLPVPADEQRFNTNYTGCLNRSA